MRIKPMTLWTMAVIAASAAFIAHLMLRFETVHLGYEVGRERREQRQLVEERRLLSIEAATLRDIDRVETIARGSLGMEVPGADRIVPASGSERSRRASGRMR